MLAGTAVAMTGNPWIEWSTGAIAGAVSSVIRSSTELSTEERSSGLTALHICLLDRSALGSTIESMVDLTRVGELESRRHALARDAKMLMLRAVDAERQLTLRKMSTCTSCGTNTIRLSRRFRHSSTTHNCRSALA
ncbi:MAG: hypothetical protein M3Q30_26660 [Actinomycetota bacterium]|nr:hypothetical protein [Actinomycetota bacterium]